MNHKKSRRMISIVSVLVLVGGILTTSAQASLLGDVNKSLRQANIAVNAKNNMAWAQGVMQGYYKSYQQLLDAMRWHRSKGRSTPDASGFGKMVAAAVAAVTTRTTCVDGQVVSMSAKAITVSYKQRNSIVKKAFSMTKKKFDAAVGRSISRGSQVKVCSKGAKVAGNVINRAPAGLESTYGGTSSGGSGSSSP